MTGEFDSDVIRLRYNSLTTPSSVIDHHIPSNRRAVRKVGFEAWGGGVDEVVVWRLRASQHMSWNGY